MAGGVLLLSGRNRLAAGRERKRHQPIRPQPGVMVMGVMVQRRRDDDALVHIANATRRAPAAQVSTIFALP